MKKLSVFFVFLTSILTINCFAQPAIDRTALPKVRALQNLDHPEVKSLEAHFKSKGYKIHDDLEDSDMYKGKDAAGEFEVEITTKTITKKGSDPVEIAVIKTTRKGITKTEIFAEDDDNQYRQSSQSGRMTIMTTSTGGSGGESACNSAKMISCVNAAMQGAGNCSACFNQIKECIRGKKKVSKKIACVLTNGIFGCIPCGLNIFEVIGCISVCSASGEQQ